MIYTSSMSVVRVEGIFKGEFASYVSILKLYSDPLARVVASIRSSDPPAPMSVIVAQVFS